MFYICNVIKTKNIMASKTFKIGERCQGGVITVEATKTKVTIIGKDWDFSQGSSKGSNQSNAKEFTRLEVDINEQNAYRRLHDFASDLATHYWACEIMDWVESKSELGQQDFWV